MSRIERCLKCGEIIADKTFVVSISEQGAMGGLKGIMGKNKSYGLCAVCTEKISSFVLSGSKKGAKVDKEESDSNGSGIHFHA